MLLLDEPLSNLDAKLRVRVREDIREIQQRLEITTVIVTHDQDEALSISDRVAVMNGGRIEQYSSPVELYRRPATTFVGGFVGAMNSFAGGRAAGAAGARRRARGCRSRRPVCDAAGRDRHGRCAPRTWWSGRGGTRARSSG